MGETPRPRARPFSPGPIMAPIHHHPVHELRAGDIATLSISLWRKAPLQLWAMVALPLIPAHLSFSAFLFAGVEGIRRLLGGYPLSSESVRNSLLASLGFLFLGVVCMQGFSFGVVAVSRATIHLWRGHPFTVWGAWREALSRFWVIIGTDLLAGFLAMMGFLMCIFPGVIWIAMTCLLAPVMAWERRGPRGSIKRALTLFRTMPPTLLGVWLLYLIFDGVLTSPMQIVAQLTSSSDTDPLVLLNQLALSQLYQAPLALLLTPLLASLGSVLWSVAWIVARSRHEGWDLALQAWDLDLLPHPLLPEEDLASRPGADLQ